MDVGLVCDGCNTFNPMGAKVCSRCDTSLSLDPASGAAPEPCAACGAALAEGTPFCMQCGHKVGAPVPAEAKKPAAARKSRTMLFSALQSSRAKLTLIKGDGLDGVSFTLAGDEHLAGRRDDVPLVFADDPYLSPVHANFFYRNGRLIVRDEDSVNGVFIRIRDAVTLGVGDRFLVGEQVLELRDGSVPPQSYHPRDDGTYLYASPHAESRLLLVQILRGGDSGLSYRALRNTVSLGREDNDIDFPDDPFISGHHAEVATAGERATLTDLGSRNGTFLRIRGDHPLEHGDYVFMGQQLLRVEIV
jgi:pSer/pThr/pTyr-binding forkhead associated (FHA) protein